MLNIENQNGGVLEISVMLKARSRIPQKQKRVLVLQCSIKINKVHNRNGKHSIKCTYSTIPQVENGGGGSRTLSTRPILVLAESTIEMEVF